MKVKLQWLGHVGRMKKELLDQSGIYTRDQSEETQRQAKQRWKDNMEYDLKELGVNMYWEKARNKDA